MPVTEDENGIGENDDSRFLCIAAILFIPKSISEPVATVFDPRYNGGIPRVFRRSTFFRKKCVLVFDRVVARAYKPASRREQRH